MLTVKSERKNVHRRKKNSKNGLLKKGSGKNGPRNKGAVGISLYL
jgi:hypothetical protein